MESANRSARIVRFGAFEVDLRSESLRKGGAKLKLSGQPFQVLAILLEQPGEIVTREELQKRLWPDTFVDVDHNLNTAINKIRDALGDTAENPRFVETVPRRGYRFIAPVIGAANGAEPAEITKELWQGHYSPDRRWIAFEAIENKRTQFESAICVVPAEGGTWIRMTEGRHWDDKPRWFPDGKILYFLSERAGYFNVFGVHFDPAAGEPVGEVFQVTHLNDPSLMIARGIPQVEMSVIQQRLMVTVSQGSGSIWVLDGADR